MGGHPGGGGEAENDGHEGAEFEQTVAPGQLLFRQQLRQQPVLGRTEECAVDAHQKNAREQRPARFPRRGDSRVQLPLPPHETRQRQQHHEYFEDLYADGHRPFAAAVREESARHGKQNERQGEQRHDQFAQFMFLGEGHVQPDEQEHDEIFQDVVAERALELSDEEAPEAAKA